MLRLPTTVFDGIKERAVFLFDGLLVNLTLDQENCPDPKLQGKFHEVLTRFKQEINIEQKPGFGACDYTSLDDIPDNVKHIGGRVLSAEARIYDYLTKYVGGSHGQESQGNARRV